MILEFLQEEELVADGGETPDPGGGGETPDPGGGGENPDPGGGGRTEEVKLHIHLHQ